MTTSLTPAAGSGARTGVDQVPAGDPPAGVPAAPHGTDFARLSRLVVEAGLTHRRHGYYAVKMVATVVGYAAVWAVFAAVGASWWQLLVAVGLGFAFTQVAFIGHDVAHRQVFRGRGRSDIAGLLVGVGIGMSLAWWTGKHSRHHANPNHEDLDPDIGAGALVWTLRQAHDRHGTLARWLTRHQGTLFFPLLLLEGMNLHVASANEIIRKSMRHRRWEAIVMIVHAGAYLAAVFTVLPVGMAVAFIAIHQAAFGVYMGSAFAPNHKGMPVLTAADDLDFLRRQVLTSRNVTGNRATDFLLGGLNYQIEHHLFPNMPRPHLRRAQPIVRAFCAEVGVSYQQRGFWDSHHRVLIYLNGVGTAPA